MFLTLGLFPLAVNSLSQEHFFFRRNLNQDISVGGWGWEVVGGLKSIHPLKAEQNVI